MVLAMLGDNRSHYQIGVISMARTCQVTGVHVGFGNQVSHSHRRTRRRFEANVQTKRYWVPRLRRQVRLRVSPGGMRIIDAQGIDAVASRLIREGGKL